MWCGVGGAGCTESFENGVGKQDELLHAVGRSGKFGKVHQALLGALGLAGTGLARNEHRLIPLLLNHGSGGIPLAARVRVRVRVVCPSGEEYL